MGPILPPRRRRSAWARAALMAIVIGVLPFAWSEDSSCDGKPKPLVTGAEILFGRAFDEPRAGLVFLGFLALTTGLAFAGLALRRPILRVLTELAGAVAALGAFGFSVIMLTHGRGDQPLNHPAAWIGVGAAFAILMQACFETGGALRRAIDAWRTRRKEKLRLRIAHEVEQALARVAVVKADDEVDRETRALEEAASEEAAAARAFR